MTGALFVLHADRARKAAAAAKTLAGAVPAR